jgi:phosphoglycolate phosphatase-like HAD superfamily hydrolase
MAEQKEKKIPLPAVKKLPYQSLNRMIRKMREYLKQNDVVKKVFDEYDVDISEIDEIPMRFGELDVSAKTDHGVIIFNYKLLTDADFFKDFSYGVHEMTHWLQQTTGNKATKSSDDGSYLDNPYEQEGFQNQVEYIAEQFGEDEAEQYVDDLLEHHEVESKKEIEEKKDTLMSKIAKKKLVTFDFDATLWDYNARQFMEPTINLLKRYLSEGYKVAVVTHRNSQEAKQARHMLNKIGINVPVLSCPSTDITSHHLNKSEALLALKPIIHYDDRPQDLKEAILGGIKVVKPPAHIRNQ